ncbi:MAG: hypothetical protein ACKOWL_06030 [Sphingobacteriaceae bacterium]
MKNKFIQTLEKEEIFPFRYSICTFVSKPEEYQEMVDSFISAGFDTQQCEYLCIDNSKENTFEAYEGINLFLRKAKGEFIILCHQDIILHDAGIIELNEQIDYVTKKDSHWGVLGNAGGINLKQLAMHLTQHSGNKLHEDYLPLKAITIDENFMLVKNSANLSLSSDLKGFHFYGTDLCIIAKVLGYNAYVIDFNLTHKSDGKADKSFYQIRRSLIKKYRKAFKGRFISTTFSTRFYLSGEGITNRLFNTGFVLFFVRQFYKYFRLKKRYQI